MMAALSTTDCSHHLFGLTHSNCNNQKQVATEPRLGGAFCRAKTQQHCRDSISLLPALSSHRNYKNPREQLICNQQVDGSNPSAGSIEGTASFRTDRGILRCDNLRLSSNETVKTAF